MAPLAIAVTKTSPVSTPNARQLGYHLACTMPDGKQVNVIRSEDDLRAFDAAVRGATHKDLDFPLKEQVF